MKTDTADETCTEAQPPPPTWPPGPVLVKVCAWCQTVLGVSPEPVTKTALTHGICPGCAAGWGKAAA